MSKQTTALTLAISGLGGLLISNSHLSIIRGYLQTLLPVEQDNIENAYIDSKREQVEKCRINDNGDIVFYSEQTSDEYFNSTFKNTNDE